MSLNQIDEGLPMSSLHSEEDEIQLGARLNSTVEDTDPKLNLDATITEERAETALQLESVLTANEPIMLRLMDKIETKTLVAQSLLANNVSPNFLVRVEGKEQGITALSIGSRVFTRLMEEPNGFSPRDLFNKVIIAVVRIVRSNGIVTKNTPLLSLECR